MINKQEFLKWLETTRITYKEESTKTFVGTKRFNLFVGEKEYFEVSSIRPGGLRNTYYYGQNLDHAIEIYNNM